MDVLWLAPASETEVSKQIDIFENVIQTRPDGIALAPTDAQALSPIARKAVEAGIPVVTVDSDTEAKDRLTYIGTDNRAAGEVAGREMVKLLGGKGKVAIITGVLGAKNLRQRCEGFKAGIAGSGLEVLTEQTDNGDRAKGLAIAENLMTANPDLVGFFADNAIAGPAVAQALIGRAQQGKVKLISFDTTPALLGYVHDGVAQRLVAQKPDKMGELGVELLVRKLKGETLPAHHGHRRRRGHRGTLIAPRHRMHKLTLLAAVALLSSACMDKSSPPPPPSPLTALRTDRTYLRDDQGRYVFFNGVNVSCSTKAGPAGKNVEGRGDLRRPPVPAGKGRRELRAAALDGLRLHPPAGAVGVHRAQSARGLRRGVPRLPARAGRGRRQVRHLRAHRLPPGHVQPAPVREVQQHADDRGAGLAREQPAVAGAALQRSGAGRRRAEVGGAGLPAREEHGLEVVGHPAHHQRAHPGRAAQHLRRVPEDLDRATARRPRRRRHRRRQRRRHRRRLRPRRSGRRSAARLGGAVRAQPSRTTVPAQRVHRHAALHQLGARLRAVAGRGAQLRLPLRRRQGLPRPGGRRGQRQGLPAGRLRRGGGEGGRAGRRPAQRDGLRPDERAVGQLHHPGGARRA